MIGHQEMDKTNLRKWFLVASSPALTAFVTVQVPDAAKARYPDEVIRAALNALAVRATVPIDEQLGLVPFRIRELAGFRVAGVIPGRAVKLSDAPATPSGPPEAAPGDPHPGGHRPEPDRRKAPSATPSHATSSPTVPSVVPNLKDVRVETRAAADRRPAGLPDPRQRAGCGRRRHAHHGAMAALRRRRLSANDRDRAQRCLKDAYPRFRSVRDGIEPR